MPTKTKKLLQMVKDKEEARQIIKLKSDKAENIEELRSYQKQLEDINKDIEELRSFIKEFGEDNEPKLDDEEARKKQEELKKQEEMRTAIVKQIEEQLGKNKDSKDESKGDKSDEGRSKGYNPISGFHTNAEGSQEEARAKAWHDKMEERGTALKEKRSITIASDGIVIPAAFGSQVNGTFKLVSSLIDMVNVMPLNGGESFRQPYELDTPAAGYTAEGIIPTATDKTYGYADINKSKIAAYSEITNEILKLPAANYADLTLRGITISCRRYISQQILIGDGATGHLTGIFSVAHALAIDVANDVSYSTIDNTTLDKIIFGYGGDEAVEGQAVLILNKSDLAAFARLRTTDGKKFHTIVINADGGTGTIDGIPYIINSVCGAISDSGTTSGAYCMAYGKLQAYQLAIFSDLDVERSTDYKFGEGMIAHRGEIYLGGNVVSHNGFLRIKKS